MDIRERIMRITKSINTDFVKENGYMDITYGGLVIGRKHDKEGGILFAAPTESADRFKLVAEIQHGEYVMSPFATLLYEDRLIEINDDKSSNLQLTIDDIRNLKNVFFLGNTSMILTTAAMTPQYVINDRSTAKYLSELEAINNRAEEEYNQLKNIQK